MRDLTIGLGRFRVPLPKCYTGEYDARFNGAFVVPFENVALRVIAAVGGGWDHVSVSLARRCPTWHEMDHVKRLFFEDGETAMQLHLPPAKHINIHPFVLHMWRPHERQIPLPPAHYV